MATPLTTGCATGPSWSCYGVPGAYLTEAAALANTSGTSILWTPFVVDRTIRVTECVAYVVTGSASTNGRLAIYEQDANQHATSLCWDSGLFSTVTSAVQYTWKPSMTLRPGRYYQAHYVDSTTPTLRVARALTIDAGGGFMSGSSPQQCRRTTTLNPSTGWPCPVNVTMASSVMSLNAMSYPIHMRWEVER